MGKQRKMGPRQLERANLAFEQAVAQSALAHGAVVRQEPWGTYYDLETRAGTLAISAAPSASEAGGSVHCIFADVGRANALLNPAGSQYTMVHGLNYYTGKWHLYLFGESDAHTVSSAIADHLRKVL